MLSVEMKINGVMLVHIYAHRGETVGFDPIVFRYPYEIYEVNSDKELSLGVVEHCYGDGLTKLVSLILEDYLKCTGD